MANPEMCDKAEQQVDDLEKTLMRIATGIKPGTSDETSTLFSVLRYHTDVIRKVVGLARQI